MQNILRQILCKQGKIQGILHLRKSYLGLKLLSECRLRGKPGSQSRIRTGTDQGPNRNDLGLEFPCYRVLREKVVFVTFRR